MKKIILLLIYMLGCILYNGQEQSKNIEVVRPVPSVAGLATYNTVPVSVQTGIPDISYPLISLTTGNKSVSINLGLSYHAANTSSRNGVSEVGKGWSFFGGGAISREIIDDCDEAFEDLSSIHYQKNEFDDIYNFNIPGESGKFRFIRDIQNNTFELVKLTPFTSKIEYQRSSNPATLILDSFTITSESGIQYIFKDYDVSMMNVWLYNHPTNGPKYVDQKYRSVFYLSSILDENGMELIKYTYLRDLVYPPGTGNQVPSTETNKLTHIEVKERGTIDINYDKEVGLRTDHDKFSINNIVVKTDHNLFVKKYTFVYSYASAKSYLVTYRILKSFSQVDQNGNVIEKYAFNYSGGGYEDGDNDKGDDYILLNSIELPTGGVIKYDFEMIAHSYSGKAIQIPAPKVDLASISFIKANGTRKYAFTLTETKTLEIDATGIGDLASYLWAAQFWRKNGNTYVASHSIGVPIDQNTNFEYIQKRTFDPGEYYLDLYCNDIGCNNLVFDPAAVINLSEIVGEPTVDVQWIPKSGLPRIKNIKYFNQTSASSFVSPAKIEEYDYSTFNNPGNSSGYLVEGGSLNGLDPASPTFVYKNVKVSQGSNNGYTKYYFKAPDAYPMQTGYDFWPNYNLTRVGLPEKKEVYNASNQKLSEDFFEYTIEEYNGLKYLVAPSYVSANFYLKTSWIKDSKVVSRNYFDSGMVETKNEIFRNTHNNKP
ncbi:hypothetical protein, partial [Chryseobacterium sp. 22458]|uniref:hypothetical protein n=1 Tax=Chryseobacterium sp. 22458 TaxID=3453921 RepID=UPI003F875459